MVTRILGGVPQVAESVQRGLKYFHAEQVQGSRQEAAPEIQSPEGRKEQEPTNGKVWSHPDNRAQGVAQPV